MVTTNVSSRRSIEEITGSGAPPPPRQSASQFSKGAVVSLRMKNFLVYKDVIAVFGPRLNVVVGPNGSGKSTLVCAIALGLAGTPKVGVLCCFCCCMGLLPFRCTAVRIRGCFAALLPCADHGDFYFFVRGASCCSCWYLLLIVGTRSTWYLCTINTNK